MCSTKIFWRWFSIKSSVMWTPLSVWWEGCIPPVSAPVYSILYQFEQVHAINELSRQCVIICTALSISYFVLFSERLWTKCRVNFCLHLETAYDDMTKSWLRRTAYRVLLQRNEYFQKFFYIKFGLYWTDPVIVWWNQNPNCFKFELAEADFHSSTKKVFDS